GHARLLPRDQSDPDQGGSRDAGTVPGGPAPPAHVDEPRGARAPARDPDELRARRRPRAPLAMSTTAPTPVVIAGAGGRMGRTLLALASRDSSLRVVGAFEAPGHPAIGSDAGTCAGVAALGVGVTENASTAMGPGVVLVDFTWPEPSLEHLRAAPRARAAAVLGTTGFRADQQRE